MGIISPFFLESSDVPHASVPWCYYCCLAKKWLRFHFSIFSPLSSLAPLSDIPYHRMMMMILSFSCIASPSLRRRHWLNRIWRMKTLFSMWWTVMVMPKESIKKAKKRFLSWWSWCILTRIQIVELDKRIAILSFLPTEFFAWEHISLAIQKDSWILFWFSWRRRQGDMRRHYNEAGTHMLHST